MKDKVVIVLISTALLIVLGLGIYGIINQNNNGSGQNIPIPEVTVSTSTSDAVVNNQSQITANMKHLITIKTNYGTIEFGTYDNDAPKTAQNFITLTQKGFYNGLTFHRVISGFMIQGGDPYCSSATSTGICGAGGPGYKFEDELDQNTQSYQQGYLRGVVAMANSGPNTNGSQFFILHQDYPLPYNYTIFGKVISGMDVVDKIAAVKTSDSDRPVSPVIMESVTSKEI
jgi:cyclophilin family peptidyl-prolyl cis-trans isomerase